MKLFRVRTHRLDDYQKVSRTDVKTITIHPNNQLKKFNELSNLIFITLLNQLQKCFFK